MTIYVALPPHLRELAHVKGDVAIEVAPPPTLRTALDALERRYPMLCGTIREHGTRQRRAYVRYYGAGEDLSHNDPDAPLPDAVAGGAEPLLIVGAIAGG